MMVGPVARRRSQERRDRGGVARGMASNLAAIADALVRLDVRAGRHFLQVDLDGFGAGGALESEDTGRFGHGRWKLKKRGRRATFYTPFMPDSSSRLRPGRRPCGFQKQARQDAGLPQLPETRYAAPILFMRRRCTIIFVVITVLICVLGNWLLNGQFIWLE
jgi:hypothetical protein